MVLMLMMRLMSVGIVRGGHALRLRLCDAHHAETTATAHRPGADTVRDVDLHLRVGIQRTSLLLRLGQRWSFGGRWKCRS
uniref:Putative secreted protein n=1 Tax=Anopheles marajoara TaxID=58244 RepID=A0A2M4CD09_9DIPT